MAGNALGINGLQLAIAVPALCRFFARAETNPGNADMRPGAHGAANHSIDTL